MGRREGGVRRETGKEYRGKSITIRSSEPHRPKSCADARVGIGEALTGERIGQPFSRGAPGRPAGGRR